MIKQLTQNSRSIKISLGLLGLLYLLAATNGSLAQNKSASTQQVNNVRLWESPDKTRVVFDVSEDVRHTMFTLDNPLRLVVDIENADLKIALPSLPADNAHIQTLRSGRPKKGLLRFVFELAKPLKTSSFVLSPNELYGHRLVVDLIDEQAPLIASPTIMPDAPVVGVEEPISVPPTGFPEQPEPVLVAQPTPLQLVVAVDAGHGGEDPGAIGYRGSREKKITLAIAKQLEKKINKDPRMRAILIREGDYYIELHRRRELAKERGADIFVSLHADAFGKRSARGMSVFALSQSGATSAMARALAAKENASDLIGGVSLADKDQMLKQVLVDLSMTNTISESVNLGGRVLKELSKLGRLHSKRVEQAGFAVLKSPDMPSILIETGFITNPDEERNLRSSRHQQKLADAIYVAINEYYQQTPYFSSTTYASLSRGAPTATQTSSKKPKFHKVVRGDSLSKIAERYATTVTELKRVNGLTRNTAVLGKRLKLPQNSRPAIQSGTPAVHIVQRGDSLSKISAKYNVTIRAIKSLNGLAKNTVYLGQKIKLPQVSSSSQSSSRPAKPQIHKVGRGDTLSEIAERYGSSVNQIMSANNMRTRTVMLGQSLKIPN